MYVLLDGRLTPAASACVSVFDRGLTFGDSLVETIKLRGGRPVFLDEHLERLNAAMQTAGFALRLQPLEVSSQVAGLVRANSVTAGRLRIQVTRGGTGQPQPVDPAAGLTVSVIITAEASAGFPAHIYRDGIACATVPYNRGAFASLKTTNMFSGIMARRQAQAAGAQEAIFTGPAGELLEGAFSNIFFVRGRTLLTAPGSEPILAGVTRGKLLEIAERLGIELQLRALAVPELATGIEGAYLSGSIIGFCPVRRIDAIELPVNAPLGRRLAEELTKLERGRSSL